VLIKRPNAPVSQAPGPVMLTASISNGALLRPEHLPEYAERFFAVWEPILAANREYSGHATGVPDESKFALSCRQASDTVRSWAEGSSVQPTFSVNSIRDLRALDSTTQTDEQVVLVLGYHEPGDGGGGVFRWDAGRPTKTTRGWLSVRGKIQVPHGSTSSRSVEALHDGPISVRFFGARDNGAEPAGTREVIQAAVDFAVNPVVSAHSAGVIVFPPGPG